jgi:type VI secretion system protein ImpK
MERETLAVIFQEPLTAVVRVWSNPQVAQDPVALRNHMKASLKNSIDEARRKNFSDEETRLAMFAIVAYLDETILTQNQPAFADWRRASLQQELFGVHTAGEIFFQNIDHILRQPDSLNNSDLLEIYALCMSLGFQGKMLAAGRAEHKRKIDECMDKCRRIRGAYPPLSPSGEIPPTDTVITLRDPWIDRLLYGGGGLAVLALVLFVVYKFSLRSGVDELTTIAGQLAGR